MAADLAAREIEAEIEARKQASAIILAEQGRWYTAIIRPLLAAPVKDEFISKEAQAKIKAALSDKPTVEIY